jgi:DNA-binding LacI/PurR family transcriptional regulator
MKKDHKTAKATITDVAQLAGVATGTVSRVLNKHADVNEDIRQRVLQAANDLGYVRLRQRKTPRAASGKSQGNIGIICFGMEDTLIQIPIVSRAVQGIETALSQEGRNLMFANVPNGDRVPPFLTENRVEGLILKGPNQGELPSPAESEMIRYIYRFPHIWLMGKLPGARGDHSNFDPGIAGHLAANHFLEKGHRKIAFFNPKPGQSQFERLKYAFFSAGLQTGLETSLLEVDPPEALTWPLPAITQQENVEQLLDQWLDMPEGDRATGFLVPSDRTSVQLYSALEKQGLRVGRDVSVISCNNEKSMTASLSPQLTSIDVRAEVIGSRAVHQLLWRIAHPNEEHDIQILIEPALNVGESVATL